MRIVRVEGGVIGISLTHHLTQADDSRRFGVRMVEEDLIPDLHPIAHERARGVIAHAVPMRRAVGTRHEVVERKRARLGLHEPVTLFAALAWQEDPLPRTPLAQRTGHGLWLTWHSGSRLVNGLALPDLDRLGGPAA